LLSKNAQSFAHLRLDGFYGDLEHACNFGILETVHATQLEHFTTTRGQFIECGMERDIDFVLQHIVVCCRKRSYFGSEGRLGAAGNSLVTQLIERTVAGGTEEICAQGSFDDEGGTSPPKLEHDILRDLFGLGTVVQHGLGNADEVCVMSAENGVVRGLVACPQALEEFLFTQALGVLRPAQRWVACGFVVPERAT
jgi:hypothetical protein